MSDMMRVGVIGLGMGRNHVTGFNAHPQAEVVAICDQQEDRLIEIGDLNNVPGRYTDAAEMMEKENLDIVSIATPNKFHHPYALMAFEARSQRLLREAHGNERGRGPRDDRGRACRRQTPDDQLLLSLQPAVMGA